MHTDAATSAAPYIAATTTGSPSPDLSSYTFVACVAKLLAATICYVQATTYNM